MAVNNDTIFYNADYIVIEYIDIVKSPYVILLNAIRQNKRIREILKIEEIENMDDASLYEWYINRKHQNFLIDLNRHPDKISDEIMDQVLEDQINSSEFFYTEAIDLTIIELLEVLNTQKMVSDVIIYFPHKNDFAKNDLENRMNHKYTFMDNFDEVLEKAGNNSTYFLSDIRKISYMAEKGYLKFSSITLPIEYRYNKKNMKEFDIDFDELFKEHPFKLSFFYSCSIPNEKDRELTDGYRKSETITMDMDDVMKLLPHSEE